MKYYQINQRIIAPKVRLIDEKGEHLGIFSRDEAIKIAQERELDLVEIGPKSDPPVAKLLNFSQFKYSLSLQERKQKKKKVGQLKEIKLSPRIGQHDLEVRINQAKKFLEQDSKVRVWMVLRGREMQHLDLAENLIKKFLENLGQVKIEQPIARQGSRFTALISK